MIQKNSSHPELDSGSRRSIKAFTLVELLVVVLIIAVLAAVAVPQYRKAVLKSRFSTLMPLAKNLWDSNEVYYLNNGNYAATIDELDVSAPADPSTQATLGDEEQHQYVRVSNPNIPNRITMYQKYSPNFAGETHCEALLDDDLANWLCKDSLQGTFVGNKYGYAVYSLQEGFQGSLSRRYSTGNHLVLEADDICETEEAAGCRYSTFKGSTCRATGTTGNSACADGTFSDGAICYGDKWAYSCAYGSYNHSICVVKKDIACAGSSFTAGSICVADASRGCLNSRFTDHSICYTVSAPSSAYGEQACSRATYDATSCCAGDYCPNEEDTCAYKGITPPALPAY